MPDFNLFRQSPKTVDELMTICHQQMAERQFAKVMETTAEYMQRARRRADLGEYDKRLHTAYAAYMMTKAAHTWLLKSAIYERYAVLEKFFYAQILAYRLFDWLTREPGQPARKDKSEHTAYFDEIFEMYEDVYERFSDDKPDEIETRIQREISELDNW